MQHPGVGRVTPTVQHRESSSNYSRLKRGEYIYITGLCHSALHERCRGAYAGTDCACPCHTEPPPQVTVRCFFGCPHTVCHALPQAAHDLMEVHYRAEHWEQIRAAVGWAS
ncbi:hypothetical protein [Mycolicibacterium sp.]|uniref:hypothetical protein n=1 Tax=Mycolicibacterium sp. TaxID=2320850 RepID=UPI00355E3DC1